jgi:hypothetical protein
MKALVTLLEYLAALFFGAGLALFFHMFTADSLDIFMKWMSASAAPFALATMLYVATSHYHQRVEKEDKDKFLIYSTIRNHIQDTLDTYNQIKSEQASSSDNRIEWKILFKEMTDDEGWHPSNTTLDYLNKLLGVYNSLIEQASKLSDDSELFLHYKDHFRNVIPADEREVISLFQQQNGYSDDMNLFLGEHK